MTEWSQIGPAPPGGVEILQNRLDNISNQLSALETRVWDTKEAGERIRERFIGALEALDARFVSHQQATIERMERLLSALSGSVEELKVQTRSDAERSEESLWEAMNKLEAQASRLELSGRETQDRLARAVAVLTIAADEWRSAAPGLADGASREVQDALGKLDRAVESSQEQVAEQLERSMVALADIVRAWKDEIVYMANRSDEKIWSGLSGLEAKLKEQTEHQISNGLSGLEAKLTGSTEEVLSAGVAHAVATFMGQMKDLEARINERQAAMVTLIIGGGAAGSFSPPAPEALSNLPEDSIDEQVDFEST